MKPDPVKLDAQSQFLRRIAWVMWLLEMALALGALLLAIGGRAAEYTGWGFRWVPSAMALTTAVVGLVILARHPKHAVGWVFSAIGLFSALQAVMFEYGTYALVLFPGSLPGGETVAWILQWFWLLLPSLFALLVLLFPDGHLPSTGWRLFVWALFGAVLIQMLVRAIAPGPLDSSFPFLENPYGLAQLGGGFSRFLSATVVTSMMILSFGVSAAGLIGRMRRSRGQERQQFKWFVFAATLLVITAPAGGSGSPIVQSIFIAAMLFVPIAMAFAILRYRLYDIDLLINRTLVYGALTVALAVIYFGSVVLLQGLFRGLTGQGQNQLVTVISTLGIAGLFTPLRRRMQAAIDQRFYRRRYDAAKTLAAFSASVRDEVELYQLADRLVAVVEETMQPAHVSLWLRETVDLRTNT